MRRVTFVLPKHPGEFLGGDMRISVLMMQLAAESFRVTASALTLSSALHGETIIGDGLKIYGVAKDEVNRLVVGSRSLARGVSPLHTRFETKELRLRLADIDTDIFAAEHSYMAESLFRAGPEGVPVAINTHVAESEVLKRDAHFSRRALAPWVRRDEFRVARRCASIGCFDTDERAVYRDAGLSTAKLLEIVLPPSISPVTPSDAKEQLVFVGDQHWTPNHEAVVKLLNLWPEIRRRRPDARLIVIGRRNAALANEALDQPGVQHLGFVDDLDAVLASSRAMVAPVLTGGGIRVKVLEAARIGLPVVATGAALGNLDDRLGIAPCASDPEFIDWCERLLSDPGQADSAGRELYNTNVALWRSGLAQESVANWLDV